MCTKVNSSVCQVCIALHYLCMNNRHKLNHGWKHGQACDSRHETTCICWCSRSTSVHLESWTFCSTTSITTTSAVSSATVHATSWTASDNLPSSGCTIVTTASSLSVSTATGNAGNGCTQYKRQKPNSGKLGIRQDHPRRRTEMKFCMVAGLQI